MALCTDIRIAGSMAKMGLVETKLAIIPGAGGTQRLPRLIGISRAKELIFTSKVLNSKEAFEYNMVNKHVEGSAFPVAFEMAREICKKGPIAISMAKLSMDYGSQCDLTTGLVFEQTCYSQG
jgi:methylglutaconyl-CoA hydratase